jgi:ribosomal protein L1
MPKQSKRYLKAEESRDLDKLYALKDALQQVRDAPTAKFDETVDIAINLALTRSMRTR